MRTRVFFREVDVRAVMMEWDAKSPGEVEQIGDFMGKYGLVASTSARKLVPFNISAPVTDSKQHVNVFFIHPEQH